MSTYLEKIEVAQKGIDDFYRLLNLYNQSRLNSGWVGTENGFTNTDISQFESYFTEGSLNNKNENVNATLFDIPMNSRGFDKNGRYGAGIPSDIGFCRNIKGESIIEMIEGTISETNRDWYSVCYGNGKFVAVAYNSNIFAYSYDGITWTEITISETNRVWYSVCYGNGKFVAVVYSSNIFAYSYDGITWTEGTISETSRNWNSVCYGNDKFVAISNGSNIFAYYDTYKFAPIPAALNQTTLEIDAPPAIYRDSMRYRVTAFGNTLYTDAAKIVNNPSLVPPDITTPKF